MSSSKVTVLMSVYNGEKYLRESIESVLNQTLPDFEFLIINDGSTDASKDIILSYKDPRIRLIDNTTNMGLTKSLNKGLKMAKGEYIARMDTDDVCMPERLQKQYEFMQKKPDVKVLGSWAWEIGEAGNITNEIKTLAAFDNIFVELFFTNPLIHSSTLFDKHFILAIGGYNEEFERTQDYDLWIRAIERRGKIMNIPLFLLKYRNHLDNLSNMESAKQEELALKAIQYAYKNLIDLKISILKIALMRSIFLSRKAIFSFADKLNVIFFLRHIKKELKTKLTHNQEAINYLNTRVNSFVNALTNSNFEKIIIKSIL